MRFNKKNYAALGFMTPESKGFRNLILSRSMEGEQKRWLSQLFEDNQFTTYFITEPAQRSAQRVRLRKIGDKFDYSVLKTLRRQSSTYILSRYAFFRFIVANDQILIMYIDLSPTAKYNWEIFPIDYERGILTTEAQESEAILAHNLLQLITFVELTDPEIVIMPPTVVRRGRMPPTDRNDTPSNIHIVNADWNKMIIRTDDISVCGYYRVVRKKGVMASVFVRPHVRHGFKRRASSSLLK